MFSTRVYNSLDEELAVRVRLDVSSSSRTTCSTTKRRKKRMSAQNKKRFS